MGADVMNDLPDGFALDAPLPKHEASQGLPSGFALDQPSASSDHNLPSGFSLDADKPESNLDYASGLAHDAASGVTLGLVDEAAAGMGSLFGLGPKLLGTKSYDEILNDVRGA